MPLYQHFFYRDAEIAVWKIEEDEDFFRSATGLTSLIHADKRRIEFYAGRFLLQRLIPGLDLNEVCIDPIGKPYLKERRFHFSISHSYPYIAVAVHSVDVVGVDIQIYREKITRIQSKFLHDEEFVLLPESVANITMLWCTKEALFKWRGTGGQDFSEQLRIENVHKEEEKFFLDCRVIDPDTKSSTLQALGLQDKDFALAVVVKKEF